MFHRISKNSNVKLFYDHQQALHLLLDIQLFCQKHKIVIVDYLLVEQHLEMLIIASEKQAATLAAHLHSEASQVPQTELLLVFKKLGCRGKQYSLCGTFELYHHSWCFCELGKTATTSLPIPLQKILQIKKEA